MARDPTRTIRSGFSMHEVAKREAQVIGRGVLWDVLICFRVDRCCSEHAGGSPGRHFESSKLPPPPPVASTPRQIATRRCQMFVTRGFRGGEAPSGHSAWL